MRKGFAKFLVLLAICWLPFVSNGQQIEVYGGFVQDSLGVGEEVQFWLRATYPPDLELLLPDSNYNFAPFELLSRDFTPTTLRGDQAHDSAVYTIQSFEIDPVQYLQLGAVVIDATDSTIIQGNMDSVYFKELAPVVTDSTLLKINLSHVDVTRQFNFPMLYMVLVAVFVVAVVVALTFGGKIRRWLIMRRMRADYNAFSTRMNGYIHQLKNEPRSELAEKALTDWKSYLERLEKRPYSKHTTKEILAYRDNQELQGTLKIIDRTVYGKVEQPEVFKKFQDIEDFTYHRYSLVLDTVKDRQTYEAPKTMAEEEIIHKTEITQFGMTREEIEQELLKGGRFVIFYYTISILVMTFRRSSKVMFLKQGDSGIRKGLGYTLVTFLLGWWGIPWGFVYTPQSLYVNLKGGKDITDQLLNRLKK